MATGKPNLPNLQAMLARLRAAPKHVIVGVIGTEAAKQYEVGSRDGTPATLAQIATWNHFGTSHIPARPFLSETTARNRDALNAMLLASAKGIAYGKLSWEQAMAFLGQHYTDLAKQLIADAPPGTFAPNAPSTIERKGSSRPLIDTGQLRGAITYRVQDGTGL